MRPVSYLFITPICPQSENYLRDYNIGCAEPYHLHVEPQTPMPLLLKVLEMGAKEVHSVQLGNTAYVVEVVEMKDSHLPTFEEAQARVQDDYKKAEAKNLAKKAAEDFIKAATASGSLETAVKEVAGKNSNAKLEIKKSATVTATNAFSEPFSAGKLREAAFSLEKVGTIAAEAFEDSNSYHVVALAETTPPTAEEFAAKLKELTTTEQDKVGSRMLEGLIAGMKGRAKIWSNNELLGGSDKSTEDEA